MRSSNQVILFIWLNCSKISCPKVYPAPRGEILQPQVISVRTLATNPEDLFFHQYVFSGIKTNPRGPFLIDLPLWDQPEILPKWHLYSSGFRSSRQPGICRNGEKKCFLEGIGNREAKDRPRALPRCTDTHGVVSSSHCSKPMRLTPWHLFNLWRCFPVAVLRQRR